MSDPKRRSSNALPLQRPAAGTASSAKKRDSDLRALKIECDQLREKLQKSIMDNPQTAKKAAFLIGLWIEGKTKGRKKAA